MLIEEQIVLYGEKRFRQHVRMSIIIRYIGNVKEANKTLLGYTLSTRRQHRGTHGDALWMRPLFSTVNLKFNQIEPFYLLIKLVCQAEVG